MGLNKDHSLQAQFTAGVGVHYNHFPDSSSSHMLKRKVPDGTRGGTGCPLGCLQNRLLITIMAGAWWRIIHELLPGSDLALNGT